MKTPLTLAALLVVGFATHVLSQDASNTATNSTTHVLTARFSPDGQQITTESPDKTVRVWDAKTGKPLSGPPNHLGVWQLVSFKYGDNTTWTDAPRDQRRIKVITESYFTWVAYDVASGKAQTLAGGLCTLSDGTYTESIVFAGEGVTDYVGKKQSFTLRVEGDQLHQSGQMSDGTKVEEVWQRVK